MPFIAPIIATAIGVGTIGTIAINLGLAIGAQFLFSSFTKKKNTSTDKATGIQKSVDVGGDRPRGGVLGLFATPGHFAYGNTYGANNKLLQYVFILGDCPHDGIEGMIVDGKPVTLSAPPEGTLGIPIPEYGGKMWLQFFDGQIDQTADPELVANANPPDRFTLNHKYSNMSYARLTIEYNDKLFTSGFPEFLFVLRGLRCYDPRKDSTVEGGSGAHRWNDNTTWEHTTNSAILLYNYRRGWWANGERILGVGVAGSDLKVDDYIAAANVCDEDVDLKAGGTEKRYRAGFQFAEGDEHSENIGKLLASMGDAMEIDSSGQFKPFVGAAQTPVKTITDSNLLIDAPLSYTAKLSRPDRLNAVFGVFADPAQQWASVSFPPRISEDDEAAEGGQFAQNLDLSCVFSQTQAQRISEIYRRKGRYQATASISLPFWAITIEDGDWIRWISDRFNFDKTFRVQRSGRTGREKLVSLQLREVSSAIYPWDAEEDEVDGSSPVNLPGSAPRLSTVTGFDVFAISIETEDGQKRPALRAVWTSVTDQTVDVVKGEYRIVGSDDVLQFTCNAPILGEFIAVNGVQANVEYEMRLTIETTPRRTTTWTDWEAATSTDMVVAKALEAESIAPGGVNVEALEQGLKNAINNLKLRLAEYKEEMQVLQHALRDAQRSDVLVKDQMRTTLRAQSGRLRAVVDVLDLVYITPNEARAQRIEAVEAALLDPLTGDLLAVATAISTLEASVTADMAAQAAIIDAVSVQVDGQEASITQLLEAVIDPEGASAKLVFLADVSGRISGMFLTASSTTTDISFLADTFQIYNPVTGNLALYFDSSASRLVLENINVVNANISGSINQDGGLQIQSPLVWKKRFADPMQLNFSSFAVYVAPGRVRLNANSQNCYESFSDEQFFLTTPNYIQTGDIVSAAANAVTRFYADGGIEGGHYSGGTWVVDTAKVFYISDAIWDPLGAQGQTKWICRPSTRPLPAYVFCTDGNGLPLTTQWVRVPSGMFFCSFKMWGAGGSGAGGAGAGGAGAYVAGKIAVTPLSFLRVMVGGPAEYRQPGRPIGFAGRSFGTSTTLSVGGGGGGTFLWNGSQIDANLIAAAGGGSGANGAQPGRPGDDLSGIFGATAFGQDAYYTAGNMYAPGGGGYRGGAQLASASSFENSYSRWLSYGGQSYINPLCTNTTRSRVASGTAPPNTGDADWIATGYTPGTGGATNGAGLGGLAVLTFTAT